MALGAAVQIAKLYATIGADVSDFTKAMKKVDDDLSFAEKGTQGLANAMGTALKVGAAAGAAAIGTLATGIGVATKQAADMEQRVADIRAVFGSTAPAVEELNKAIQDLGLDPKLKVSATEAADAIEMLAKNGVAWDQVMQGAARSAILLANATNDDFALAADVATDVMAQFNIEAANMGDAVDGIIGVTQQSKFSINDYALAIAQAGGVAGSVGVDFDDFNAVIAATSPSFASGSDAGTSFKVFLQRLVPQTDKAKEALDALNLRTADGTVKFFDASGQMKSMSEIAGLLQGAFHGLSESQKIEAASTIFGTDAMRTAFALAEAGSETIDKLKAAIGDTSAEEIAAMRMDTLKGSWEIFTGIVEALAIGIGQKFLPVARTVIDWASDLASKYGPRVIEWAGRLADQMMAVVEVLIAAVSGGAMFEEKFEALPGPIKLVVKSVEGMIATVKELFAPVSNIIGQVVNWKDALIALGILGLNALYPILAGFAAAMAPVLAQVAIATAVVAALRKAWESDWGNIRSDLTKTWTYLKEVFGDTYETIRRFGGDSLREIAAWMTGNKTSFEATLQIWQAVKDAFKRLWDDMVAHLRVTNPQFLAQIVAIRDGISNAFQRVAEYLGVWRGDWDKTFKYITSSAFAFAFMEFIRDIPLYVQLMVKDAIRWFNNWKLDMDTKWQDIVRDGLHWWNSLVDTVVAKAEWWGGEIKKKMDAIYWTVYDVWRDIRNQTQILWQAVIDWILPKWESLIGWWQPQEWLKKATDVVQGFWNGIKERWTAFTSWWSGKWEDLKTGFKNFFGIRSPSTVFQEFGENIGAGLELGIDTSIPGVQSAMDDMADAISSPSLVSEFSSAGTALGSAFGGSVSSSMTTALEGAKKQLDALKAGLGSVGGGGSGSTSSGGGGGMASGINLGGISDFLASRASDLYDTDALAQVDKNFKQATIALGNAVQKLDAGGMSDANLTKQISSVNKLLAGVAETGNLNGGLWSEIDSTLKSELNYLVNTIKAMRTAMTGGSPSTTSTTTPTTGTSGSGTTPDGSQVGIDYRGMDISTTLSQKTGAALADAYSWMVEFAYDVQQAFQDSGTQSNYLVNNAVHALTNLMPESAYNVDNGQITASTYYTKARTDNVASAIYTLIDQLRQNGLGNQFNVNVAGGRTDNVVTNIQNAITYLYALYG